MHPIRALRNRDWLVLDEVTGSPASEPRWTCVECRAEVDEQEHALVCRSCGRRYAMRDGVPDFFGPPAAA